MQASNAPSVSTEREILRRERLDSYFRSLVRTLEDSSAGLIVRQPNILDFGAGSLGYIDLYQKKYGGKAYALDVNDYSAHYGDDVEFVISNGENIPLENGIIDLLVSHSVLEHVSSPSISLSEISRVVRAGGIIYLTVSPLYFSPRGPHNSALADWEQLDPKSPYFLTDSPFISGGTRSGAGLNQLTISQLMTAVTQLPWQVLRFETKAVDMPVPEFVDLERFALVDLLTKEFRLVARKLPLPVNRRT